MVYQLVTRRLLRFLDVGFVSLLENRRRTLIRSRGNKQCWYVLVVQPFFFLFFFMLCLLLVEGITVAMLVLLVAVIGFYWYVLSPLFERERESLHCYKKKGVLLLTSIYDPLVDQSSFMFTSIFVAQVWVAIISLFSHRELSTSTLFDIRTINVNLYYFFERDSRHLCMFF